MKGALIYQKRVSSFFLPFSLVLTTNYFRGRITKWRHFEAMKVIPESFLFHTARHDLVEKKKKKRWFAENFLQHSNPFGSVIPVYRGITRPQILCRRLTAEQDRKPKEMGRRGYNQVCQIFLLRL